ncbi:MAG: Spx/MgsR family RNA polymerase-binding regulatory protein [Synechococcales bacterium]|nr:Spx/MgsR family RNA polymerase-binding regulatory protein [Synechococcales bacterium]
MSLQVYGIPNCGTCKKAIAWLAAQGIDYAFIDTKQQPPDLQTITAWVETLGSKPMRNTSGQSYRALGNTKETWSETDWITAFSQDAMLLKRPLFVRDGKAIAVGFRDPDTLKGQLT